MRLQVGPKIENNQVRLDFKQSPGKPDNMPSYQIAEDKADEFVNKYNDQSKTLLKTTIITSILGGVIGIASAIKAKTGKLKALIGFAGGTLAGFGIGVGFSSYHKNRLMKQYNIKEI